jgi:hypothetical protein
MRPTDTDPGTLQVLREIRSRVAPAERLKHALEASDFLHELALSRLRSLHPDWSEAALRRAHLRRQFPVDQLPELLR